MLIEKKVTLKKYRNVPNVNNWIIVKILEEQDLLDKTYKTNKNTLNTLLYAPDPKHPKALILDALINALKQKNETKLNKWKDIISIYVKDHNDIFKKNK